MARQTQTAPIMHAATQLPRKKPDDPIREVCLLCGEVWPCTEAPRTVLVEPLAPEPSPELVVASAIASNVPWPIVAAQLGVPEKSVQAYLDSAR